MDCMREILIQNCNHQKFNINLQIIHSKILKFFYSKKQITQIYNFDEV